MCKVLMIAGVTESKQNAANKFLMGALPSMSEHDKDGVGYAASEIGTGELFGERWLYPKSAFKRRTPMTTRDESLKAALGPAVAIEDSYSSFGNIGRPYSAVMLHTRMATCGVNLENVHPFVTEDTALIHNGIITNASALKRTMSTCDSEAILHSYLDAGVDQFAESIQDSVDELEGYYACGVLARDRDGSRVLDIFKSETASLYVSWVSSIEAWAYCTRPEILRAAAKKARTTISTPHEVNAGYLIRLHAESGRAMSVTGFTPKPRILAGKYQSSAFGEVLSHSMFWDEDKEGVTTDTPPMSLVK